MALPDSNYAHLRKSSLVFQCQFKVDSSFGPASCTTNESSARVQLEAATVPKLKVVEKPDMDERFGGKGAVTFVTSRPGLSVNSVITGSNVGDERSLKNGNISVASSSASNTLTDAQPTMGIKKEQLPLSGGATSPSATLPHARCDTLYPVGPASSRGWGIPPYERLRGGGENGTATGGWGPTPVGPSSAAATGWGNPSQTQGQNQWGATAAGTGSRNAPPSQGQQQAPASAQQSSAWNQSAKNVQENSSPSATAASAAGNGSSATSTGQQKDPNAREVIYSVDGWCSNNVNQDTTWDVPHSPGLAQDKDIPGWKQTANNGTEVWEATLRNGGQVPAPQTQPKAPWGYTPSTNIGGTWEEEDDAADSSSAWGATSPQWGSGGPASGPVGPNPTPGPGPVGNAMWGGPKKEPEWPNPAAPIGAGAANSAWGGVSRMGGMGQESEAAAMGPGNWSKGSTQWGAPGMGPKEMAGWGDQSPPSQKRMPVKEEGTALWGNAQPQQHPNKSHWQEMPVTNIVGRGMQPPGPPPGRGPHGSGMKDLPMWGAPPRNGSWGDVPGGDGGGPSIWMEGKAGGSHWNEPQTPTWGGHGQKARTPTTPSGWGEPEMLDSTPSWGQPPKPSGKNLSKDFVWASKQFRILSEMGFKKDDVENALRVSGMNVEDALEMLYNSKMAMGAGGGGWRPPSEDHSSLFDQSGPPVGPYGAAGQRYGGMGQQQPMGYGHQGAAHLLGNPAGPSMGLLQKGLPQQHPPPLPPQGGGPGPMFGIRGGGRGDMGLGGQPSPAQLHGLVQQIQTAVRAGHLNPQILNQPLAPQTLILLNQLLQQLKILQQLGSQQAALGVRPSMAAGGPAVQLMQQMTKTKQQIVALQNQISAQQALYMKQQGQYVGQQLPGGPPPSQPGDMYKSGGGGGLDLSSKFEQISIQDGQSRLNQWKRTSPMDKNELDMDFSRAPGASGVHGAPGNVSKPPLAGSLSSPNLNPLLGHGEGAWSSLSRSQSDSGWPESATADLNSPGPGEGKDTWAAGGAVSDLVPEFKPGEPWKGPLLKTIEDDPTLTPAQFMGGGDGFGGKSSSSTPPAVGSSSSDALSSTTWSFNSSSGAGNQSGNKFGQAGDLWGAAKPRGPPPGISAGGKYGAAGGWSGSLNGNSPFLVLRNLTPQIDGSTLKTLCLQHGPVQNFHLYLNQGVALVRYSSSDEAAKAQGALNNCGLGNTTILADLANENDVQGWLQQLGMPGQQQQQPNQQQQSAPGSGWGARGSTPSSGNGNSGSSKPVSSSAPEGWNPPGGGSSSQMWSSGSGSVWSSNPVDRGNPAASSLNASLNSFLPGDLLGNEPM